ncbi:MAG: hypothetical protein APR54_08025 [Candidatus Cloacimonas sp. SDB]|nr:MAG: hypothetical protein APR54_08025 [Candidatus Cloacimonas sp. SDB]
MAQLISVDTLTFLHQLLGRYLGTIKKVQSCNFDNNNTGIYRYIMSSIIEDCTFDENEVGIDILGSTRNSDREEFPVFEKDIFNCVFYGTGSRSIRSANSTPRIEDSELHTTLGIMSCNNSYANCSYEANNIFNSDFHLIFGDEYTTFSAGMLLNRGHNDFYDQIYDMLFNTYYDGDNITIDCNGNWWGLDFPSQPADWSEYIHVQTYGNNNLPNIIADYENMDISPNVFTTGTLITRFDIACQEESDENYIDALNLFKDILTDKLYLEKDTWNLCISKVFDLSVLLEEDLNQLILFYEDLIDNVPGFLTENEITAYIKTLEDHIKKCYIHLKEYQPAADMLSERIEEPESTLDSLYAVIELENLYLLSSMSDNRAALHTSHDKLAPENINDLSTKQAKHWEEIDKLLGFEVLLGNIENNIPSIPILMNNYPNPFNPETTIKFSIPEDKFTEVTIFNLKGQKVKTLLSEVIESGSNSVIWNGTDQNNKPVSSGVYFYNLSTGSTNLTKKMILLK